MHSTKNVNETHSSQFLMETSLDLGIKRRRELGSPLYPSLEKKGRGEGGGVGVGGVKLLTTWRKEGTTLLR